MNLPGRIFVNNEEYTLIKDYKDNEKYRKSLNRLARRTYGFDFEEWYQQGYWGEKYLPYSLLHKDEIVANVSVNPIDFLTDGCLKHTIQLGTVMTEEAYRYRGLSRLLMERILQEYENSCELIYLYANDTVLDFYPKFGFCKADEFIYIKEARVRKDKLPFRKLKMTEQYDKAIITRLTANTLPISRYQMVGNTGLLFFYLTSYLSECIYYFEDIDLAAVAEMGEDGLTLIDLFCEKEFDLDRVIGSLIDLDDTRVSLGFTPFDHSSFQCEKYREEGLTFFVRGNNFINKGRFPVLSHA